MLSGYKSSLPLKHEVSRFLWLKIWRTEVQKSRQQAEKSDFFFLFVLIFRLKRRSWLGFWAFNSNTNTGIWSHGWWAWPSQGWALGSQLTAKGRAGTDRSKKSPNPFLENSLGLCWLLFLFRCCKAKQFSHFKVVWDSCVRGAALSPILSSHLQAEPAMGGGTTDSADNKFTHSEPGAQRYGEEQLDQKRLFNLGDKEIKASYWRMKLDKFDSEQIWVFLLWFFAFVFYEWG